MAPRRVRNAAAHAEPAPDRAVLHRAKAALRRRTWLLALAWLFTGLPLSFVFDSGGFRFLLMRDAPGFGRGTRGLGL